MCYFCHEEEEEEATWRRVGVAADAAAADVVEAAGFPHGSHDMQRWALLHVTY